MNYSHRCKPLFTLIPIDISYAKEIYLDLSKYSIQLDHTILKSLLVQSIKDHECKRN